MKILGVLAVLMMLPLAAWGQPEGEEHAKARLICESKMLTPGKTAWFALHFEIDPHWHLYWNGQNDSGFAPRLKVEAPAGYKVGEMQWPAPKRLVLPGDILDHIYEGSVSLLFPVSVPADAKPGSDVEVKGSAEWLVCHEVCLPGGADLSITLKVGDSKDGDQAGVDAALFAKARQRIPKAMNKERPEVVFSKAGDKVVVLAAGAVEVAFYPGLEGAGFPQLIKEGKAKGERLVLSVEGKGERPHLKGVVEVKPQGGGSPMLYGVDVDLESLNQSTPGPSDPTTRPRGD